MENEKKTMTNEEFKHVMDTMKDAKASMPLEFYLSIMADIVKNSGPENKTVKEISEAFKKSNEPIESVISKTVLMVSNSVVVSIWNLFGPKLEELAKKKTDA